jgi:hypothetical protein
MLIPFTLSGYSYTAELTHRPSSDQATLTNASLDIAARKRIFMSRDVGVAGFYDHVNSLVDCAQPFTIEHLETYRWTNLALKDAGLNAGYKVFVLGSFGLRRMRRIRDAILIHNCAVLPSDRLT